MKEFKTRIRIKNLKLMRLCPECNSGDVDFCNISLRPHCNDCNYWGGVNYESVNNAISKWNNTLVIGQTRFKTAIYDSQGYPTDKLVDKGCYIIRWPERSM